MRVLPREYSSCTTLLEVVENHHKNRFFKKDNTKIEIETLRPANQLEARRPVLKPRKHEGKSEERCSKKNVAHGLRK